MTTLTRRDSLIHLLETLHDALTTDNNTNGRAGGNTPTPQLSHMYHEGSYHHLERALAWLKTKRNPETVNGEKVTGRELYRQLTDYYCCPYTIRTGCPTCGVQAPPDAPMHRHSGRPVPMQPIRVSIRPATIRPELVAHALTILLNVMPATIRIPSPQEKAA